MYPIGTVINFCTIDYKFIRHCVRAVAPFSRAVVVPHADSWFDNTPEDRYLIDRARAENPEAEFVEFSYHHSITEAVGSHFWHNFARWTGLQCLSDDIRFVLFLDADEIVETDRFSEFLYRSGFDRFDYLCFSNYWYWREPRFRARTIEDSPVMVRRSVLNKSLVFHDHERAIVHILPDGARRVDGMDGRPMFHHYSWVRTREEMLRKVRAWGHNRDADFTGMVEEEFARPFNGTDFIHKYAYDVVEPPIILDPVPTPDAVEPLATDTQAEPAGIRRRFDLTRDAVGRIDPSPWLRFVASDEHRKYVADTNFREHYRLLGHFGSRFRGKLLFDVGTCMGYSALSLAHHPENTVISYDLQNSRRLADEDRLINIQFRIGDAMADPRLAAAALILLNINHDGATEWKFYEHLIAHGFKGVLLLDDIHLNPAMERFWGAVRHPKIDLTDLGHWSGTGLVWFGGTIIPGAEAAAAGTEGAATGR